MLVTTFFLICGAVFFGLSIYFGSSKWLHICDAISESVPGWIVVGVLVDAFMRLSQNDTHAISKRVIVFQLTANIFYALAFSAFAIFFKMGLYWTWYIKTLFEFISLWVLTLTLIEIVKMQLIYQEQSPPQHSPLQYTQTSYSAAFTN